jgi:hypothetical protein
MATQFAEGRYLVRIVNQRFIKSTQKGTPGFQLGFRVLRNVDQPETPIGPYPRDTTWWLTEKTIKRTLHDLHGLGYEGNTLAGVDPDNSDFHDFRDQEFELICSHKANNKDEIFEQWSFQNSQPKLEDKTELDHFDRLLNPKRERTNGGIEVAGNFGITNEDVPF